eukprot:1088893-Amphidinium_carterae.1
MKNKHIVFARKLQTRRMHLRLGRCRMPSPTAQAGIKYTRCHSEDNVDAATYLRYAQLTPTRMLTSCSSRFTKRRYSLHLLPRHHSKK